jgi:hypothetical protein
VGKVAAHGGHEARRQAQQQHTDPAVAAGVGREAHRQTQQHAGACTSRCPNVSIAFIGTQPILDVIFRNSAASLTRRNGKLKKEFDGREANCRQKVRKKQCTVYLHGCVLGPVQF